MKKISYRGYRLPPLACPYRVIQFEY